MDKWWFFCCELKFLKFIRNDNEILEKWPFRTGNQKKQLTAFKHYGLEMYGCKKRRDELEKIYKKINFENSKFLKDINKKI